MTNALRVWRLPKTEAIALTDPQTAEGKAIRAFYAALQSYYPEETSASAALDVLRDGVHFMRVVKNWWQQHEGAHQANECRFSRSS